MVASSISPQPTPSPTAIPSSAGRAAATLPSSAGRCAATLSIAGRAGHAFTPQAMLQGFVCHARGVELPASGSARVHARVRSKRVHDVHLRAEHGKLLIACSCPARSFGIDVCKHAWAALLEVDRQDALADLRKARGPLVVEPAPLPPKAATANHGAPAGEAPRERAADAPSKKGAGARAKSIVKAAAAPKDAGATQKASRTKAETKAEETPAPKASASKRAKAAEPPARASAKERGRGSKR